MLPLRQAPGQLVVAGVEGLDVAGQRLLASDAAELTLGDADLRQFQMEPYRLKLTYMLARVEAIVPIDRRPHRERLWEILQVMLRDMIWSMQLAFQTASAEDADRLARVAEVYDSFYSADPNASNPIFIMPKSIEEFHERERLLATGRVRLDDNAAHDPLRVVCTGDWVAVDPAAFNTGG